MDTFIKKYICEDWIPIKKKFDKVTLYISKKLLDLILVYRIKKQDLRKKIPAHQHITYERTLTQQIEGDTYDLKERKILKHSEQWSIALGKTRQYIDQLIREGNRLLWEDIGEFYIGDGRAQEQSIGWGTGSANGLVIYLADTSVLSYN
ncbi:uncharacterized protein OCT59_022337 [Rhizophagus irregularis]|uniref:uncharacterized protein n=1 Tax=Rhizophagus irregularis TaxID=588596 RepID=UPI00332EE635|nr:hypothetical protein OCT59_022337 [Rhizophagus irregularis]